jgi:hypothetical protein
MGEIILCNISDVNSILKQKREEWVYNILGQLGFEDEIQCDNVFAFRDIMNDFGLHIELKSGGEEVDIYKREWHGNQESGGWLPIQKKHLIAQWKSPKFVRTIDGKDVYYEIHTNEWSMIKPRK